MKLNGIMLPLTTPFESGKSAAGLLQDNIARYEESGLNGYLVVGSTGEAALLDRDERVQVWEAARAAIPQGKPLIAGTGVESTSATIRMTRTAADCGADFALILTPFFFRKSMTGEALAAHYQAVADVSPIPVLLYNNPIITGIVIPPAVVGVLCAHENIAGLKDSAGDLGWMADVLNRVPGNFAVISGHAFTLLPALTLGASGGILAVADAVPEPFVSIYEDFRREDTEAALRIQKAVIPAVRTILGRHGVPGVKAAMDMRGLHGGHPRPPLLPASEEAKVEIKEALEQLSADKLIPSTRL